MTVQEILARTKDKMERTLETSKKELGGVRTGRASLTLLDPINVEAYDARTPLKHLANLSTPDSRTILIHPWDKTLLPAVEKAIMKSDLQLTPQNDGNVIRINIPALTEERRKDLVKLTKKLAEEGRIALRNVRHEANKELKSSEKSGEISEDESHKGMDEVQKFTDQFSKRIDEFLKEKEQEIMNF